MYKLVHQKSRLEDRAMLDRHPVKAFFTGVICEYMVVLAILAKLFGTHLSLCKSREEIFLNKEL